MKIKGKAFVFGDNVNTDEIIPARYLFTSDPDELAKYCMEDLRPGFGLRDDIRGGIFIAGENFGCGSSREHAPISIKAAGIGCVIARSFARIYLRNSINIGLPIIELEETSEFKENDEVDADFIMGKIVNHTSGKQYSILPYPQFMQEIIQSGGWMNYVKKHLTNDL
jgi:3-isopropylmalate/(R)-2-methylmalate dehydratase small subunit